MIELGIDRIDYEEKVLKSMIKYEEEFQKEMEDFKNSRPLVGYYKKELDAYLYYLVYLKTIILQKKIIKFLKNEEEDWINDLDQDYIFKDTDMEKDRIFHNEY